MMTATITMRFAVVGAVALLLVGGCTADNCFFVEGEVYCDTCRAGFVTNVTTPIQGAKVRLECRHFMTAAGTVERSAENVTDAAGNYKIELKDNRGSEEVCAVRLLSSPVPGCTEIDKGRDSAPVTLVDAGLATKVRRASALGFLKTEPLPNCGKILSDLALGSGPSY
ncbi:pollen-specific protein C13 [Lolium perenne]|uniref:pollen-specific protein C13 n=1 Tax=Lolium perenne TaxID=4522 RepID=UPI0021EA9BDB|nr:pollen-specific protein C13-like [Lolium perenne]